MADDKTARPKSTASQSPHSASDVVLADSQAPTEVRPVDEPTHVSDVKLAESMSDVKLADSVADGRRDAALSGSVAALAAGATGSAPSFRAPAAPPPPVEHAKTIEHRPVARANARDRAPLALLPGAKVDDFEVVKLLGRGAFGHVYLARQLSLDRLVALKVSANRGSEGRTMARLEHQHIVQVFSEKVEPDFNQRLLCMQLVPGIGLDKLINMLHAMQTGREHGADTGAQGMGSNADARAAGWTGADLLAFIDHSESLPTTLDPSALHDREALSKMDDVETTAWFGTRLAEALDFAHQNGVLHRDIKPANILVNPYGRPMLADFNISSQPVGGESSGEEMFGGTFAYMAPEHLDAFNPDDSTAHEAVTARSDIYSLGLVLQQLLEGRAAAPAFNRQAKLADTLRTMSDQRRRPGRICKPGLPSARMTLERSIGRCLEPDPVDRFASGAELGAQLDGCRHLREAEKKLPQVPSMFAPLLRRPFLWLVILVMLPHVVGSILNITYNQTQIVGNLDDSQKQQFVRLVAVYNAIIYPIAIVLFVVVVRRVSRCWKGLSMADRMPEHSIEEARRRALRLPRFIAGLAAFGWFPGGFIFPLAIHLTSAGLTFGTAAHFVMSFCMSGLIALSYSLCGVEFIVLRVLYPGLWRNASNFTERAREELAPVYGQLNRIELLAVSIPLIAAIVFIVFVNVTNESFKALVIALIVLGFFGFHFTSAITRQLSRVLVALTNSQD